MLFEVSMTNDDHLDNRFKTAAGRIPEIKEDEEINHLMFADYDKIRKWNTKIAFIIHKKSL